jgi:hypothetical protein
MAKFKKGESGNPNGRPQGAISEKAKQWEIFADYCMNGGLKKYQEELEKLKGEKYLDAFNALLEYHKPKLARSDVNHSGDINIVPPVIKIQPLD